MILNSDNFWPACLEKKSQDSNKVKSLSLETQRVRWLQLAAPGGQGSCPAGRVGMGTVLH